MITNSLLVVPRTERYFIADESKWIFHTNIGKIFTRDRFAEIQRFVHFCDPNMMGESRDRLRTIRPVLDHLQEKFKTMYVLARDISVDESMIPFKGRLSWTQRMPQKPVKVGIKVFVLAEQARDTAGTLMYTRAKRETPIVMLATWGKPIWLLSTS